MTISHGKKNIADYPILTLTYNNLVTWYSTKIFRFRICDSRSHSLAIGIWV